MIERRCKGFRYLISWQGTLFRYRRAPVPPADLLTTWRMEAAGER